MLYFILPVFLFFLYSTVQLHFALHFAFISLAHVHGQYACPMHTIYEKIKEGSTRTFKSI